MSKFNPKYVENIESEIRFLERIIAENYNPVGGINLRKMAQKLEVYRKKLVKIRKKLPEEFV